MLKPYICVGCEKVIIGQDNVPSLISLFSKMIVAVPTGSEVPKDAVVPTNWFVFSIWETEPGDEVKKYVLVMRILYPDGTGFGNTAKQPLVIEKGKRAQMTLQVQGMPIGQVGDYTVQTWIEESDRKVVGPIEFKFGIEWREQEPAPVKTAV